MSGSSIIEEKGSFNKFDDFNRLTINASAYGWTAASAPTGGSAPLTTTAVVGGVCRMGCGTTDNAICDIKGDIANFKANAGGLVFETRLRVNTAVTNVAFVAGLVNEGSYTVTPWKLIATTYSDDAAVTDGCAFLFDTDADTDTIRAVSTLASATPVGVDTSSVPVADTYIVLRMEVTSTGFVTYFIDGVQVATTAASVALTPTVGLVPYVAVGNRDGATNKVLDIDYIRVGSKRV